MVTENTFMSSPGPDRAATEEEVYKIMEESDRPVWSATSLADYIDVSRPTATDRLRQLQQDDRLQTMDVGNVTVYYVPNGEPGSPEEESKQDIRETFEGQFVGLPSAPWTAVNPEYGAAKAGSEVQLVVSGGPQSWKIVEAYPGAEYEELTEEMIGQESTQALISGRLYAQETVPIRHTHLSDDDPDLETRMGVRIELVGNKAVLIADGVENHLLRPCNDAVFVKDVQIDDISLEGEGEERGLPKEKFPLHRTREPAGVVKEEAEKSTKAMLSDLNKDD